MFLCLFLFFINIRVYLLFLSRFKRIKIAYSSCVSLRILFELASLTSLIDYFIFVCHFYAKYVTHQMVYKRDNANECRLISKLLTSEEKEKFRHQQLTEQSRMPCSMQKSIRKRELLDCTEKWKVV